MFPLPRMVVFDNIAPIPEKVIKISVYQQSYFALTDSGDLYSSGSNSSGQLGLGNTISDFTQWQLAETGVDEIYGGFNSVAVIIRKGNSLYLSGKNTLKTGNASGTYNNFTMIVSDISTVYPYSDCYVKDIQVADTNLHVLFGRISDANYGSVFAMGNGVSLGLGTTTASYTLAKCTSAPDNVLKISGSNNNIYILTLNQQIFGCGNNTFKQIINNSTTTYNVFTGVGVNCNNICCGDNRVLISRIDGLYEVGNTFNGQVNDYTRTLAFSTDLTTAQNLPMAYDTRSYVVSIPPEVTGLGSGLYVKGQSFDLNGVSESKVVPSLKYAGITFKKIFAGFNNYTYTNDDGEFYISGANGTGAPSESGDGLRIIRRTTNKE